MRALVIAAVMVMAAGQGWADGPVPNAGQRVINVGSMIRVAYLVSKCDLRTMEWVNLIQLSLTQGAHQDADSDVIRPPIPI